MNDKKKTQHRFFAIKYDIPLTILLLGVIGLLIYGLIGIVNGVDLGAITKQLANRLIIVGSATGAIVVAIFILALARSRFVRTRQYNEEIFATDRGVFSEKSFVDQITKRAPKYINKSAVVAFSIFELKKAVMNLFGYQMVAKIAGSISSTLINRYQKKGNPHIYYGFDYNENFLLFYPFSTDISEVLEEVGKLDDEIQKAISQNGLNMDIFIFYGVYALESESMSPYEIIRRALIAADFGIRNKININQFQEYMLDANQTDVTLNAELNQALERQELQIFYQPKFDIKLNRFVGAEALIRWDHPTRGLLYPSSFIPFAERSDLITKIDRYVIDKVCQDISYWKDKSMRLVSISVNLSRRTIYQSDLIDYVTKTLKTHKTNPLLLELELTESTASRDLLFISSIIKRFKALGIKSSIDDFGTGYSSLSYLKKMPFDTMKIDKSFFDDIEVDKKARDVVKAMIDVAAALNVYVVAEGIQTAKQVSLLKGMGCNAVQGFFFSHSLSREKFELFLQSNKFEGGNII